MKIYTLTIIVATLLISHNTVAQPWLNKLLNVKLNKKSNMTEFNFFETQKAFNEYWKDRKIEKGKGWKQFKRWEWFMQSRVDKNGFFDKAALWKAWQEKKLRFPKVVNSNSANWTTLGPEQIPEGDFAGLGRINCIAVDPHNNNIIWVGSPSGGLWKSPDGGNTWNTNTDFLDGLGVSSILISPFNSNIMYLSTGDFDHSDTYCIGILKSTDGGQSWFLPNNSLLTTSSNSYKLTMHPTNENVIYACSESGIIKSTNGGIDWINTTENLYGIFCDFIMDKTNPDILYAAARLEYANNSVDGIIIKSTNGGESWFKLTNGLPSSTGWCRIALAQSSSNPNIIYSLFTDPNWGLLGVYKSTDSGNNWVLKASTPNMLGSYQDGSDIGGQGSYDLALIVNPTNPDIVYLGGVWIWKTTDGGNTWAINSFEDGMLYIHADIHAFEFIPNSDHLFVGCDGGLYKTTNGGGQNWQDLSNGLGIQQFYRIGGSAQIPNFIYGGAQDNGTSLLQDHIWTYVTGADGMECAVDYTNHNIGYVSAQFGSFSRTTDGGNSFTPINDGVLGNATWTTPFLIHPTNPEILYRASTKVYKSTNRGDSWNAISEVLDTYLGFDMSLMILKVSKSNPNYIYVSSGFNIFKTSNGGDDWVIVVQPAMNQYGISDIAIHPDNPEIIYYTNSTPAGNNKILKSTDSGNNWTNVSGEIPENLSVNCIVVQDDFPDDVYIGTDIGVFYSETGGDKWQDYSENLPNVIISELEINNISGKIRAATYGRGLWESPLNRNTIPVELTSFTGNIIRNGVNLTWSTATETNNKGFSIERKTENENWFSIGFVEGNGTILEPQSYHFTDSKFSNSGKYYYRLKQIDFDGTYTYSNEISMEVNFIPTDFSLSQNFPNPFNPSTIIRYDIPKEGMVSIKIYDMLGREVKTLVNEYNSAGSYNIEFNASNLTSGIYFYMIKAGGFVETKKLILIK